ncbi:MAG TPA: DUF1232 domain-containing protein [Symbiobacteriaceae bacterium]|nr:DUF1232 domain-containing protein [Symbiobacteriaceae bacterium]
MLRAAGVEILLTREDLEETLRGHAAGRAEVETIDLQEGAVVVRLKVSAGGLGVAVPVELRLGVRSFRGMEAELDVAWSNMGLVPGFLKEMALQKAFEALPGEYRDGSFYIDLADVMEDVPLQFELAGVHIQPQGMRVSLRRVMVFPVQPGAMIIDAETTALVPVPSTEEARIPEHQGYYQKLRERVRTFTNEKAPRWAKPLVPWVMAVPDFFVLMVRLARDERVPASAKVIFGAVVAYFILPVDLIPDPIPLVGEIDDVALAIFALEQIGKRLPPNLVQELWPGEGQVADLTKAGVALFQRALPTRLIDSLRRVINR